MTNDKQIAESLKIVRDATPKASKKVDEILAIARLGASEKELAQALGVPEKEDTQALGQSEQEDTQALGRSEKEDAQALGGSRKEDAQPLGGSGKEVAQAGGLREGPQSIPSVQSSAWTKAAKQLYETPKAIQPKKETRRQVELSKPGALSLQAALLKRYSLPAFQKKLHELARLHNATEVKSAEYRRTFLRLVRSEQIPVIERYGFEASEEGVTDMLRAFKEFGNDKDVYVNAVAIKEALFSASTSQSSLEPPVEDVRGKPKSREDILYLLRTLLFFYSIPHFQARVVELKLFETDKRSKNSGYYHLTGRAQLALEVQATLLPKFGFEASREGVRDMISLCAGYLSYPEVAELMDDINIKLGMTDAACQRFRKLTAHLATDAKGSSSHGEAAGHQVAMLHSLLKV